MTSSTYHIPVMLEESLKFLVTHTKGIYVDGTLGAGGHTRALLERLSPEAKVYGIDQDDEALAEAGSVIGSDSRFRPVKGNFGYLSTILPKQVIGKVDGILLDLGVSSHQIDAPERGFSFREDGPLDMRMGNLQGLTAADVVNTYSYEKLRDILFQYGEERKSGTIARTIIENRPLSTTTQLKQCVEKVIKGKFLVKSLARVFQAIRIEVNQELQMLRNVLEQAVEVLKEGGRLVVISYHSLEDRLVKYFFKSGNFSGKLEKDFYGNIIRPFEPVFNNVLKATEQEIEVNSRARSARLRVAEKTGGQ